MPWIVTKYKSRHSKPHKMKATFLFTETEIERLAQQPDHCYTIVNTTTRQVSRVGGACKKPTPQNMWGIFDFFKRKKKPHVNPMSKRMIWEPGAPSRMFGRARKRRRR